MMRIIQYLVRCLSLEELIKRVEMKKLILMLAIVVSVSAMSQETKESLGKKIDELTYAWDLESDNLDDYEGMSKFCFEEQYRFEVITMLKDIHHYDSVLLERLQRASRFSHDKEIAKTLKDIEKFEKQYSMKEFIAFLYDECQGISEIERNREDLEDEIGQESYDGRILVIETELAKYIHHITKRVDAVRDHVHHLHIE